MKAQIGHSSHLKAEAMRREFGDGRPKADTI
jgi:hypothetical protein